MQRDEPGSAKSTYASSRTRIPFQNDLVAERRAWTDDGEISFPVGLPGDVNKINFIVGSDFRVNTIYISTVNTMDTFSTSICQVNGVRGTSTIWTSLIAADTLYIPYVGVQIMILSFAG